jgi:hypothetical protein
VFFPGLLARFYFAGGSRDRISRVGITEESSRKLVYSFLIFYFFGHALFDCSRLLISVKSWSSAEHNWRSIKAYVISNPTPRGTGYELFRCKSKNWKALVVEALNLLRTRWHWLWFCCWALNLQTAIIHDSHAINKYNTFVACSQRASMIDAKHLLTIR